MAFVTSFSPSRANAGHDRFLPDPYYLNSSEHMTYVVSESGGVVKQPANPEDKKEARKKWQEVLEKLSSYFLLLRNGPHMKLKI